LVISRVVNWRAVPGCRSAAIPTSSSEGEIVGLIGSGLFARFGDVFEGFLPARRLPGEYHELNALGTALEGRRTGKRFRLGDPIEVRVEKTDRSDGKVSLVLSSAGPERRPPGRSTVI
jgi:ribonuclease R